MHNSWQIKLLLYLQLWPHKMLGKYVAAFGPKTGYQHSTTLCSFFLLFFSFVFLWQDQTAQTDERKNVARTMQKLWLGSAHRAL